MSIRTIIAYCFACTFVNMANGAHVQWGLRSHQVIARGVNLGGWLITEHWMNPSEPLWNGVNPEAFNKGEYVLMKALGEVEGNKRIKVHRDTWITEADIEEIASYGLNLVRVPVGYWISDADLSDPSGRQDYKIFAKGGIAYLDALINQWALKHNIAVLIDIHAVKGSQNGNDHSAPADVGQVYWDRYPENVNNTLQLAEYLAQRYHKAEAFLGISLLNEPSDAVNIDRLMEYYTNAYEVIRKYSADCVIVTAPLISSQSSGWDPSKLMSFMPPPVYQNVWNDWHNYLAFDYNKYSTIEGVYKVFEEWNMNIAVWQGNWLFGGEWSFGYPSTLYLNLSQFKQMACKMLSSLNRFQSGWTFWSWRGEVREWSLQTLLRNKDIDPKWFRSTSC